MTIALRERSRDALKTELARAASQVFAERGFDETTVDEVSRELGISRATFFRYFGSKEEAIIFSVQSSRHNYADVLEAVPIDDNRSIWSLLRATFEPAVDIASREPDRLRAGLRLVSSIPSLRAKLVENRSFQVESVAAILAERRGDALTARACTAAAFAVLDIAWAEWAQHPGIELSTVLDRLFDALAAAATPAGSVRP